MQSCRLPQGTLSPLLLKYLQKNDITLLTLKGELVCYADDTALIETDDIWEGFHKIQWDIKYKYDCGY